MVVQKKKRTRHPEAQGLFLLALNIVLFLSLISFSDGKPSENWLGVLGYTVALGTEYLFGLGAYLILVYSTWIGWKLLSTQTFPNFGYRTFYFSLFLCCVCILLNIFAEHFSQIVQKLESGIYSETILIYSPFPKSYTRYNLGGVPFYYMLKDVPYFNLLRMMSAFGTTLIFSITGLVSFLLLTQIRILPNMKIFSQSLRVGTGWLLRKLNSFFLTLFAFFDPVKIRSFFMKKSKTKHFPPTSMHIPPAFGIKKPLNETFNEKHLKIHTSITPPSADKKQSLLSSLRRSRKKNEVLPPSTLSSYRLPPPTLLESTKGVDTSSLKKDLQKQALVLEDTLKSFGIEAKVSEIHCGPTITSFEVQPPVGVKVQKIKGLENDIALNLEAKSIRIIAPIPGKAAVGVEIPSTHPQPVGFKELLQHYQNRHRKKLQIPILLGKTVGGEFVLADLVRMPHLLVAGATGSGKSVCINTIVMSTLMNARPDQVKLLMIDPKKVELTQYSTLPHMIAPVISEAHGAYAALQWMVKEMKNRYDILKQLGLRNITAFNSRKRNVSFEESLNIEIPEQLPLIVGIIDEFADLMMVSSSDLETPIARIAQMARAVGLHLILATQRPSREVITGIIKANFPSRIAFKVASRINSQIILDETGAESLLGNGDLLFLPPGSSTLIRAQGSFISDDEINRCVQDICDQSPPNYLIPSFDAMKDFSTSSDSSEESHRDELYDQALQTIMNAKFASTTYLQRKLKIGYARAASLMDELESNGIVGPQEGSRPRKVLTKNLSP